MLSEKTNQIPPITTLETYTHDTLLPYTVVAPEWR